jgi:HlyD family secretion protein
MSKKQKNWLTAGVVAVVIVGIVLLVVSLRMQASANSAAPSYQTTTVQLGTLTSNVDGTGTVASLLSADVNWVDTGQVDNVNFQIGDQVKAGDVLATLVPNSTLSNLQQNLVTAQENLSELTSPEAIANAQLAVTTDQANVTNAQTALNNQQYWQNESLVKDQYAKLVIAKANLDKAQNAYDKAKVGEYINNANEAVAYQNLYNAQQAYNTAEFYYSLYSQAPTQRQVNEAQANLDLANATLASDQNYLAALTGGTVSENATGTNLLKLNQAKLAVQSAQEALDTYQMTAPFDGTITQSYAVPNAMVKSGSTAFRIDDLSKLAIDVQVVEIDVNQIKVGQPATISFDAIPNKTYTGKVIKSDLAGTVSQNSVNFIVTVQLTDAVAKVRPGMSANVTITTNKVDNALLVPSTSIFTDSNNNPYVNLITNIGIQQVPVTIGATSDSESQIISDKIKAGDLIVLSFSSASSGTNGFGFRLGGGRVGNVRDTNTSGAGQNRVVTP